MIEEGDFHGAKVAFFVANWAASDGAGSVHPPKDQLRDSEILVYRRDNRPDIPFANLLDLPGGGRENGESGGVCIIRETLEEFGIAVTPDDLQLIYRGTNWREDGVSAAALFFVARLSPAQVENIRFGEEGQYWALMPVAEFLQSDQVVPHLQLRVREYFGDGQR